MPSAATALACPTCGATSGNHVTDSRVSGHGIRRRRKCGECGSRFTTYEVVAKAMPKIDLIRAFARAEDELRGIAKILQITPKVDDE